MMKRTYEIRDVETDEVVHPITTDKQGGALDRFEDGLYRRTDLDRFYISEVI